MKMTKIAAMLPLLMAGAVSAAAQDPFYLISEVVSAANIGSANYGPWALSISGDGAEISSLAVKSDWYHYFHMSPSSMDLAHRFHYENGCTALLSSTTCKSYLETSNWAATWFSDLSSNVDQTFNVTSSAVTAESAGIVTKYGSDTTAVTSAGYMSLASHGREAVATLPSATAYLNSVNGTGYAFASAYDILPVGSNYLVVGTAGAQKATAYSYCYNGNSEIQTYSPYCPGYETQAAFWLVNASGTPTASLLATSHNTSTSTNYPYTASAMGVAKVGSEYIAVGYSATVGYGVGSTSSLPKNVAAFWNLGDGSLSSAPTALVFANDSDNPGTNSDYTIDNSWAVGVNANGYIVGNRTFRAKESRNYPTKMFIAKYSSSSDAISSTATPITTSGVNSEAAAVNNADQVVGWTDERGVTSQPVYGSVSRLQEAFIYNINSGNRYALNDLICGLDSAGAKSCLQNGKYYYIEYANGITDDGAIVASARRFDSYTDWSTLTNGTNVVVKLSVSSTTAFDNNHDVPAGYVVANQLPVFDFGASDSSGGGSFGIFGLLAMAGAAVLGQYRRFVKKGS
nr:DUF3466 family protein [uncultured Tolumonas sp.]